jgi:isopenicillin N synthase-like dioxygenase
MVQTGITMSWIPVIDLRSGEASATISDAAERVGFFSVVGHGVSSDVIEAAWSTAWEFFDLPLESKMQVAMPHPGYPYGYLPLQGEMLAASLGDYGAADLKESLAIGPVDLPTHTMTDPDEASAWSPSLWPPSLPHLRPTWERYFREMAALSARLLSLMAVALDMPPDYFEPLIDRHTSAMRALNYPSVDADPLQFGAGAHTDYGTLTVLLADPVQAGLEIQDPQGLWQSVAPVQGALVVNLGDAMARWTNDRWRSTLHRVMVPAARRQSIAFFHNANWDARIACLPACLGAGEQPKYTPIQAGPHLMSKFRSTVVSP